MPAIFDGMGAIAAGVFGDPVMFYPAVGDPAEKAWILRETALDLLPGEPRSVAGSDVVLRVPRDQAVVVAIGDEVTQGARRYRVAARIAPPLQGDDALVTFEMEDVS